MTWWPLGPNIIPVVWQHYTCNRARRHSKGRLSQENGQCMYHSIALAELISEIQNSKTDEPRTTVFKLSDLRKLQGSRQKTQTGIHSTRLKARLHRRFLLRQLDAVFVALTLQLQNRTRCDFQCSKPLRYRGNKSH